MKVRKISIFNKLFIWLAILLLVGNGLLSGVIYNRAESMLFTQIQSNAKNIATCAAANISTDIFQKITYGDEGTEAYATIINELALFRDNADLEYIYTMRKVDGGDFEIVVDSDTKEPASIGEEVAGTDALNNAYANKAATADDERVRDEWGVHVSAYSPIFENGTVVGLVGIDISASWIDEQMNALRKIIIIICACTYVVSLLILGVIMGRFKISMSKLNDKVKELASGSGDLTKEVDITTGDELEVIAGHMNEFIRQIRGLVKDVAHSSEEILQTGDEIFKTVDDNNRIMNTMNAEIEEISANMQNSSDSSVRLAQDLSDSAAQIADFAKNVNDIRHMVQQANENAQRTSNTAKENRKNALESIQNLQERMRQTSQDAQKIENVKQIAEEIGNIASQTQMLSLNAQIEAARAGAMGAGFTVVATEVGNLSNEIDHAVAEINDINSQVLSAVQALTEASEEMIRFVSEDVVKDYDAFANLGEEYGNTTDTIRVQMAEIGDQSTQISNTISDISAGVQDITTTITSTAESANQLASSTNAIADSFADLNATSQKNSVNSENLSEQVKKYTF